MNGEILLVIVTDWGGFSGGRKWVVFGDSVVGIRVVRVSIVGYFCGEGFGCGAAVRVSDVVVLEW